MKTKSFLTLVLTSAAALAAHGQSAPPSLPPVPPKIATPVAAAPLPATNPGALVFDQETKSYATKPGEMDAPFTFFLTNASPAEVVIERIQPSCGCTTAKLPPMPWHLPPGAVTNLAFNMNLAGKSGAVRKRVDITGNHGVKTLNLQVDIAPSAPEQQSAAIRVP